MGRTAKPRNNRARRVGSKIKDHRNNDDDNGYGHCARPAAVFFYTSLSSEAALAGGGVVIHGRYREATVILPIIHVATTATTPAVAKAPDTTTALNRITPRAYPILSSAHLISPTRRPNIQ